MHSATLKREHAAKRHIAHGPGKTKFFPDRWLNITMGAGDQKETSSYSMIWSLYILYIYITSVKKNGAEHNGFRKLKEYWYLKSKSKHHTNGAKMKRG